MRETLTEIIGTHVEFCGAGDAADAIIAALPDMVCPLEWDIVDEATEAAFGYGSNLYTIWAMDGYGYVLFPNTPAGERFNGGRKAAKAAAQAHHTAAILSAFGVQGGEA
jgi:hypothetical protein